MMAASIDERQFSNQRSVPREIPRDPTSRWPRQRGLGGDAFPRPRSGGAPCFQSRLVLSAATTSRSPLLGSGGRSRRREVGGQVSRVHLEEIHRLRQPAEAPGAKAPEADPVWERFDDRRAHGRRHDDLHRDGRFRIIRRERAPSTTRVRWPRLVLSERGSSSAETTARRAEAVEETPQTTHRSDAPICDGSPMPVHYAGGRDRRGRVRAPANALLRGTMNLLIVADAGLRRAEISVRSVQAAGERLAIELGTSGAGTA
jgi:hypothetical protein